MTEIKRESGVSPELSRSCKLLNPNAGTNVTVSNIAHGKTGIGGASQKTCLGIIIHSFRGLRLE